MPGTVCGMKTLVWEETQPQHRAGSRAGRTHKTLQKFPEMGSDHSYTSGENTNSALKSVPAAHGINLIAVLIHAGNFHASSNSVLFPKYTTVGTTVIEVIICYFFINN